MRNHLDRLSFCTKTRTKEECRVTAPPPTAITCDTFVRIKQDICRLFGLSMISSMQISGIQLYQDLMFSCQGFPSPSLFPLSQQQQAHIFLWHSSLNYSLNKGAFRSSFRIFSQGILYSEDSQLCRFPLFCCPLQLTSHVHLLSYMQNSASAFMYSGTFFFLLIGLLFKSLYVSALSNGDVIKNMSLWWRAEL